jgi:hypothetical protein
MEDQQFNESESADEETDQQFSEPGEANEEEPTSRMS